MRAVQRVVEVPASERVEVTYTCEEPGCDFETADEREARTHRGREHAVRGELMVNDLLLVRFDSESDFSAFSEAVVGVEIDEVRGSWAGPGWYGKRYESEPCGRGCCSTSVLKLVPINDVREEWQARAERLSRSIDVLDKLIDASSAEALPDTIGTTRTT